MSVLTLSSGFTFDYTNLYGDSKVTAEDISVAAGQLTKAHQAIVHMRSTGIVKGHLSKDGQSEKVLFTQLPYIQEGHINSPHVLDRLKEFGESLRYKVDTVISFGIGGSFLGNKVLFDIHCGDFYNFKSIEERKGYPKLYFSGNNLDPRRTEELIGHVINEAAVKQGEPYRVTLVVISKSGSTLETMATFMVAYERLKQMPAIEVSVVAVTDPAEGANETLLHKLAREQGWPMFSVADGVGGRFSVFSEVGLVTAACIGFNMDAFLAGAKSMDKDCQTDNIWQNPAFLNAALKYMGAEKYGRDIEIFMPYGDYLKSVSEWYIQLLAESLGKRVNRDGQEVFYGRTPVAAVGTTDMHAQTQQHQDGKRNKIVQFVRIAEWDTDPVIPNLFPETAKLADIAGLSLSQGMEAARQANAQALASDYRFNATFTLPKLNAYHLGELLYLLALSVAYEGELANVDAFDQPGVETYKRILGPSLQRLKNNK